MAELFTISRTSVFNQVYPIQKPDYSRDVTDASTHTFVLVHLTSSLGANSESRLLTELWRELARQFGDIKFCEMKADMCIEGYPEKNTPTILVYHDGDIKRQVITLGELAGTKTGIRGTPILPPLTWRLSKMVLTCPVLDLEKLLIDVGALKGDDSRLSHSALPAVNSSLTGRKAMPPSSTAEDDDDEWV